MSSVSTGTISFNGVMQLKYQWPQLFSNAMKAKPENGFCGLKAAWRLWRLCSKPWLQPVKAACQPCGLASVWQPAKETIS